MELTLLTWRRPHMGFLEILSKELVTGRWEAGRAEQIVSTWSVGTPRRPAARGTAVISARFAADVRTEPRRAMGGGSPYRGLHLCDPPRAGRSPQEHGRFTFVTDGSRRRP